MLRSMYSGVSGLKNHQVRMDVIGNNIANINTAGYKKSRVVFQDTLYQTMRGATSPIAGGRGGTNPMGIGLGMKVSSIDQIHTGAPTTATNKLTDMAIDGNGYFVLRNGQQEYYTRAGSFDFDRDGTLINTSNGFKVQGWVTQISPTTGDWTLDCARDVEVIDISGFKTCEPQSTRNMTWSGNLNAATPYNEVQTLTFGTDPTGGAVGGLFGLRFNGQNTALIAVGADTATTAANIQRALENLTNIGEDNVAVSYNSTNQNFEIKFQGTMTSQDVGDITVIAGDFNGALVVGETVSGNAGTDEVNGLVIDATGGTYTLTYGGGGATANIAYDADAAAVQAALIAAYPALDGNVTVTGTPAGFTITFDSSLGDVALTSDATNLTGGTSTAAVSETTPGDLPVQEVQNLALGSPSEGAYTLQYGGSGSTVNIAYNATAAEVQASLIAAYPALAGNVTVVDDGTGGFNITFDSSLGNVADLVATPVATGFTGGAGTVAGRVPDNTFYPLASESIITSKDVWDSLGNKETVYFRFFKYDIDDGPPRISTWACDMSLNNPLFEEATGYDASTGYISESLLNTGPNATMTAGATPQIIRLLDLQFDDNGKVVGGSPDTDPFTLTINRAAIGAEDIEFEIDPSTMTQFAGSTITNLFQNGYGKGSLMSYTIGVDGTITGGYDNGEARILARVALARFENPSGLKQVGGTIFQKSGNSGDAVIGAPTESGMGDIVPSSLEMSNVDLSEEFTDMITTQRGFQANSRIITTSDEMIQELVNLKR